MSQTTIENKLDIILNKLIDIEKRLSKIENKNSQTISTTIGKSPKKIIIKKTTKKIIKSGTIRLIKHPNITRVTGDTFDKKHILKECKGLWTPEIKGWTVNNKYYDNLVKNLEQSTKKLNISKSDIVIKVIEEIKPKIIEEETKPLDLDFLSDSD